MSKTCQILKRTGEICGSVHGAKYEACSTHRARDAAKPAHPCEKCGKLCHRERKCHKCGFNDYRREWRAKQRAAAENTPPPAVNPDLSGFTVSGRVTPEEVLEEFERALHGDLPWPEWAGIPDGHWCRTRESFADMGESQAATQAEEQRRFDDAEALALALAEAEEQQAKAAKLVAALRNLTGHPRPVAV